VVGPHETARSGELLGGPRAAARLLSAHGWDVLYLQVGQLPAGLPHRQQLRRLETCRLTRVLCLKEVVLQLSNPCAPLLHGLVPCCQRSLGKLLAPS